MSTTVDVRSSFRPSVCVHRRLSVRANVVGGSPSGLGLTDGASRTRDVCLGWRGPIQSVNPSSEKTFYHYMVDVTRSQAQVFLLHRNLNLLSSATGGTLIPYSGTLTRSATQRVREGWVQYALRSACDLHEFFMKKLESLSTRVPALQSRLSYCLFPRRR